VNISGCCAQATRNLPRQRVTPSHNPKYTTQEPSLQLQTMTFPPVQTFAPAGNKEHFVRVVTLLPQIQENLHNKYLLMAKTQKKFVYKQDNLFTD